MVRHPLLGLVVSSSVLVACGGGPEPVAPAEPRVTSRPAPAKPTTSAAPSKPAWNPESPIAPLEPTAKKCDPLGYCYRQTPVRDGRMVEPIAGIWGSAPDNVYFVGEGGLMLRYDGKTLSAIPAKTFKVGDLSDVWGTGPNDIYVPVATRGIAHFDGTAWTDLAGPRSGRIVGRKTNDFWVAQHGTIERREGDKWTSKTVGGAISAYDAWESGPSDGYVVGDAGLLYHYDGATWTKVATGLPERKGYFAYRAVWGSGPNDVFVGSDGPILHFDGKAWTAQPLPKNGGDIVAIRGTGPNDVYAVGARGTFSHYDGTSWTLLTDVGIGAGLPKVTRMWFSSPDDIWFGGTSIPLVRLERTFAKETSGTDKDLFGVYGADGEAFAVGDSGIAVHQVGGAWKAEATGTKKALRDVWMGGRTEAWAVGDGGTILQWDGKVWKSHTAPTKEDLRAVTGAGGKAIAVGKKGTVVTFDGKKWTLEPNRTNADLTTVAAGGQGIDDFTAAGDGGTVLRGVRNPTGARDITAETVKGAGAFRASWFEPAKGASAGVFVAVVCDEKGTTFRYVFRKWEKTIPGAAIDVRGGVRIGETVWAAGARGLVHASTERTELPWLSDIAPAKMDVMDAWGVDEKDVLFVGKGGAIARRKRK